MSTPEQNDQRMYKDVTDLLFSIASQIIDIDQEADRISSSVSNHEEYSKKMRERAMLIQSLPAILHDYEAVGGSVPTRVKRFGDTFSAKAAQALELDNINGMRELLDTKSKRIGEPNELEMLAISYQPDNLN